MDGTVHAQPRDAANRFVRTTPDPDAKPHSCERLAKTFTGESATTAAVAPPTQKRMRNPRRLYAPADCLYARKVDIDADFSADGDHSLALGGRLRSTASILRDGALRQHRGHKSAYARLGLPSTMVPDHAADAFAVAVAGRVTGYPGELLWARWAGMDCRRIAATLAWSQLVAADEIDPLSPWQQSARRAVLHGVTRALYSWRYTRPYSAAAKAARMNALAFTRISKRAQREMHHVLHDLERAFFRARFGNDLPTELAPNI
ncbi:MAG TPA: hypothetical protein VFJ87_04885 [Rhodanobacteraceae bacterium]|nr:hypothetical protein [Rhodanobacteraceae bacterium]